MASPSGFIRLRNYILVRIRGVFCYALYIYRFYPKLKLVKAFNKHPVVPISIGNIKFRMQLDLNDEGIAIDLFIGRLREYPNVLFFRKFLDTYRKRISTIVEIGANIGYYVAYEHAIFQNQRPQKNVRIFAVEPVSRNVALLQENVRLNSITGIKVIQAAAGGEDKSINLIVPAQGNYTQIEGVSGGEWYQKNAVKEKVRMYSLQTLFSEWRIPKKNVLFRWDIEGYEYNLVKENYRLFKSLKNVSIIMEFHAFFLGERRIAEFLNLLKQLGFSLEYAVSCYPPYFIRMPRPVRWFLIKTWLLEHGGTNLGLLPEFKSIDDLIRGFRNPESALYVYTNLHFYLVKK
ncbi:FkbM family methyltransferase [Patescibacteria group bacterium]|nr:FkbM family methyltransferase [Patescibacteria group bacterium]